MIWPGSASCTISATCLRFARRRSTPSHPSSVITVVGGIRVQLDIQWSSNSVRRLYIHRRPSCRRQTLAQTIPPSIARLGVMIRQMCQTRAQPGRELSSRSSSASREALGCIFNLYLGRKEQRVLQPHRKAIFGRSCFRSAALSCNRTRLLRLTRAMPVKSGTYRAASSDPNLKAVLCRSACLQRSIQIAPSDSSTAGVAFKGMLNGKQPSVVLWGRQNTRCPAAQPRSGAAVYIRPRAA